MKTKNKIVVTGGSGRFGKILKSIAQNKKFLFPTKKDLNILNIKSIINYLKKKKAKTLIHLAGLSRPLVVHEKKISESIKLNIIGTSNVTIACSKLGVKLIYFSSSYVYPGKKGNYKETNSLLPSNNYSWSKLGGESAVQMYKNSLILRVCMTENPFIHKKAFGDVKLNFIFHEEVAKILLKLLNKKGIINVGGPTKTVYEFAKKYNPKIKKVSINTIKNIKFPKNASMNIGKLKKIINRI
jgi:dTDP-4-dehydrorhamnose reductase